MYEGLVGRMKRKIIARHLWRIIRRWKCSITAILALLLMVYVLFWIDNPLMEMFFFHWIALCHPISYLLLFMGVGEENPEACPGW
jgi:hypothetical protein